MQNHLQSGVQVGGLTLVDQSELLVGVGDRVAGLIGHGLVHTREVLAAGGDVEAQRAGVLVGLGDVALLLEEPLELAHGRTVGRLGRDDLGVLDRHLGVGVVRRVARALVALVELSAGDEGAQAREGQVALDERLLVGGEVACGGDLALRVGRAVDLLGVGLARFGGVVQVHADVRLSWLNSDHGRLRVYS